ncbi:hypothetical protein SDC9_129964 [bioreactor metagenome]|uniref:NERD domain-containing protein n=1 Tax=bioreactor metagenome TaxID=1076179 RepID=A0A645D2D8_9ZZZZ
MFIMRGAAMSLFDRLKEPVFLKDDSEAERQLAALQELREKASGELVDKIDEETNRVNAGIWGEQTVRFELQNSHIPMYILHDLFLEYDGLTAQIDYLIVTRKQTFMLECKNLYGNIEINNAGDFIRTITYGHHAKKEGIYSPITQNRRHLELIKQIRSAEKGNFLTKALFAKCFDENYRLIVVLANPKTVLYDRYAKKEIRQQVIRADQLAEYIRKAIANSKTESNSDKDMESLAQFFLGIHREQETDYTAKFREALETQQSQAAPSRAKATTSRPCSDARETNCLPKVRFNHDQAKSCKRAECRKRILRMLEFS